MSLYDIVKSYDGALDLVVSVSGESRRKLLFFSYLKICFQVFFLFPEGKRKGKKIVKGIWGFSLQRKLSRRASGLFPLNHYLHFEYKRHIIYDKFERAHVCLRVCCI